ncbi:hypothetical protein ACFFWD_35735 [Bradyrhizobium erythrophlei]|uniref:hypothetical protein n=1 Tax=Bradyrhizobium erythrophlei TaxID=1437360 RepID=UPI0035EAE376
MAFYAQTTGTQSTDSESLVPMTGLTFTIPEGVGTTAIVILNVPFAFATGSNNPGGTFGISVDGVASSVIGGFTYNEQVPPSSGRVPTTVVVGVPLTNQPQTIQALWSGVRGGTVSIDSPATLTAIMD